ncbi:homoserine O-acetyltransferase MetX [Demequina aurantiaca]|uniref:homoserine O-acetyltransferase MetX n=1 Tax=Demequina aurantiaca TaxID=676200 RepID=UPI003D343DEC
MDDDEIEIDDHQSAADMRDNSPIPASGAWREGDPAGRRQFFELGDLELDIDPLGVLPGVRIAYETWGQLNAARDNAVYIAHALTGDSHATGPAESGHRTGGWWPALVGPGKPVDTDKYFVVSANVVGGCQGSTGPASPHPDDGAPWGSRFPYVTIRDMVRAEIALTRHLGVPSWRMIIGPSMGGMRAIEIAVMAPELVKSLGLLGTCAATTADQLAWNTAQLAAIRADPAFAGGDFYGAPDGAGPHVGMGIARMIAHTTYRSGSELTGRFGREVQGDVNPLGGRGQYAVESYLRHHADKLARRFDANTYIRLVEAMCSHDVGRGRGGVHEALSRVTVPAMVMSVDTDRLYPVSDAQLLADALPGANGVTLMPSAIGHDGLLVDSPELTDIIREFVEGVA